MNQVVSLRNGKQVRLNSLAPVNAREAVHNIRRIDRAYVRNIGFEFIGTSEISRAAVEELVTDFQSTLPVGFSAESTQGTATKDNTSLHYLAIVCCLLAVIYGLCAIYFESLLLPFYIVAMTPVSFIGLFLAFGMGRFYFDQGGWAALIILSALAANSGLLLINGYQNYLKKGKDSKEAVYMALLQHGKTILLVTATTICSLFPFLLGSTNQVFWFGLAVGTIGGMIVCLVAVFTLLPAFLMRSQNRFRKIL
ncbi:MAG: efflux RND transporter permease subunit [Sphingobacteriia bacterium]|nr:efflux RND transporter permease subunit [Sphingobacteriia bacterium]